MRRSLVDQVDQAQRAVADAAAPGLAELRRLAVEALRAGRSAAPPDTDHHSVMPADLQRILAATLERVSELSPQIERARQAVLVDAQRAAGRYIRGSALVAARRAVGVVAREARAEASRVSAWAARLEEVSADTSRVALAVERHREGSRQRSPRLSK